MQDAFSQDMFNISDLNNPRYNGHVQSSCGLKATGGGSGGLSMGLAGGGMVSGGKKDRKGCTKGKIEAIMRNNAVRTKVVMPLNVSSTLSTAAVKKSASSSTAANHLQNQQQSVLFIPNHQVSTSSLHTGGRHDVIRVKEDHDDPYTFTESEPQVLGIYQAGGSTGSVKTKSAAVSSAGAVVQHHRSTNTLVSAERSRTLDRSAGLKLIKSHQHNAASNISSGIAIHDHIKTGKMVQTVQELTNRSPRAVPKRKIPSAAAIKASTGGNSSFHNQGHYNEGSSKPSHYHHHVYQRRSQQTPSDRVCLQAKQQPRKSVWQRERNAKHELLERIHGVQAKLAAYNRDLYPLGVEVSDSESDDFELDKRAVYERHWFSRTDPDVSTSGDHWNNRGSTNVADNAADESESPRERRVECARAETRRRLAQTLSGIRSAGEPSAALVKAVVRAARVVPNATALLLSLRGSQTLPSPNKAIRGARFLTTGEKCSYYEGCNNQALPATRHCLRHIMYNVDQRLFSHCTGRLEDNTQCNRPTFDPAHVSPLCSLHTTQAQASVVRSSTDSRHSRKKSRMLGMSRNSKRNNKKKKKSSSAVLSSSHEAHSSSTNNSNSSNHSNGSNHNHSNHHHINSTHHHSSARLSSSSTIPSSSSSSSSYSATNHVNYQLHQPLTAHHQLIQKQQAVNKQDQQTDTRNAAVLSSRLQHSVGTDTAASPLPVPSSNGTASHINEHLNSTVVVPNVGVVENIVGPTGDILIDTTLQHRSHPDIVEEVSEEVLAIEALDPVELANQTTRLLEEHDLNNVLNQISTDLAFNDLFTDKNGEYEPTREETEELERALEAVDNDVRSLERMSRALPLPLPLLQLPLEGLLDTTAGNAAGPSSSPTGGSASGGNFDSASVASPTTVDTFHNGYVSSPVVVANSVPSSTIVSDTLHQTT